MGDKELVSRPAAAAARDELGYDWFERLEERRLSEDGLRRVRDYAEERGITFFASPHDDARFASSSTSSMCLCQGRVGEAANERFLAQSGPRASRR